MIRVKHRGEASTAYRTVVDGGLSTLLPAYGVLVLDIYC